MLFTLLNWWNQTTVADWLLIIYGVLTLWTVVDYLRNGFGTGGYVPMSGPGTLRVGCIITFGIAGIVGGFFGGWGLFTYTLVANKAAAPIAYWIGICAFVCAIGIVVNWRFGKKNVDINKSRANAFSMIGLNALAALWLAFFV